MNAFDFEQTLREVGALKDGHFVLTSGRHSDRYVEKFDLLRRPRTTELVCHELVSLVAPLKPSVVAGPTTGGILLAFEIARQLGVAAAYAERSGRGAEREFRRGTTFSPGSRVLVVDDIVTTGGSVRETLDALARHEVDVVGVAVLVDRSGGQVDFGVPVSALSQLIIPSWDPDECPLCARGSIPAKPGSSTAV
ncbi:MAG TPA: orotate phosphoribosyltransferase [Thermomicrobiaceae bacterium]|nr:orotate phosphoribosyltransferase [Thermomicrobiaceae bacterium]